MRFGTTWMLLGALTLGTAGCVAQSEVDQARRAYLQAREQIVELEAQLEESENRLAALRSGADDQTATREQLDRLRTERDQLREALANAESQLREMGASTALPAELDADLERLAGSNPELMSYDADRGMIRFRSDLTFSLGSADVRDGAAGSLRQLAELLGSAAARPYEVRVVGHTDNVPIRNPGTREKHPTNWHLSAHRAIAVKDVLEGAGLNPGRMNVSGYGEYRPVQPHRAGGVEANRRVEIYLVAMSPETQEAAGGGEDAGRDRGASRQAEPEKGQTPRREQPAAEEPALFK